jgi:hypothetical protein
MRAGRAKPRLTTHEGGAGRRRCGEEAQVVRCYCGRGGGESSSGPEETSAAPVWKRRGRVIRAAWAADLKRVVLGCERGKQSWHGWHANPSRWGSSRGHPDKMQRPDDPDASAAVENCINTYNTKLVSLPIQGL